MSGLSLAKMLYGTSSIPLHITILTDGGSTSTDMTLEIPEGFRISLIGLGTDI